MITIIPKENNDDIAKAKKSPAKISNNHELGRESYFS